VNDLTPIVCSFHWSDWT